MSAAILLLLVVGCYGQWNPPAHQQPIGFIPIYQNVSQWNQTRFNHTVNRNQTGNWRNATSNFNQTCLPVDHDVPKSHSLFLGCRKSNDTLLFNEVVSKSGKFFRITEKYLEYPGPLSPGSVVTRRIYAIHCYDLRGLNKGGYANVVSGGVGHKKVQIHLYTRTWNTPLNFRCQIFGH